MFPRSRPIGCGRMPVSPPQEEWNALVSKASASDTQEVVNRLWCLVTACTEAELCGFCDNVDAEGLCLEKFMGRSQGAAYKQVPVWPKRASGRIGRTDLVCHGLAWIAGRLAELRHLSMGACQARRAEEGWKAGAARQWRNLHARFRRPSSMLKTVMAKVPEAVECMRVVKGLDPLSEDTSKVLEQWARWASAAAKEKKRKETDSKRNSWASWVEQQLKKGSRRSFQLRQTRRN